MTGQSLVSWSADASRGPRDSGSATDSADAGHTSHVSGSVDEKPEPTFTSSLTIPVEGSLSTGKVGKDDLDAGAAPSITQPGVEATSTKRTPRKSKMDALAALNRSRSPSLEVLNPSTAKQSASVPTLNGTPNSASSSLDMSTVKTIGPRNVPPRTKPRLFGLEDCPTFYPSPEEFKDPMGYIKSISPRGHEYGIIKIVPPIGWKMPFVIDTEVSHHCFTPVCYNRSLLCQTYRFKTRAMRLNSIEASSRAKINFLEALYRFHRQQGNPRVTVPTINHKPLDLWLLRKEVQKIGGFEVVS